MVPVTDTEINRLYGELAKSDAPVIFVTGGYVVKRDYFLNLLDNLRSLRKENARLILRSDVKIQY